MRTSILKSIPLALSLLLAGAAHAQVKLAVAGPVTGANAAFGAQLTQGVQQAVEDINKAGGILGQKVEVEIGDDVSDPKQGVSVANKFVGDGVKFVVGHFNSGVTMPASDVYAENGVLFITPSATNPKITDRKLWDAFRTCGRDDQQGMVWAELATSSKARRSRSCTTRPPTAKASPTPRSTTCINSASRRFSTKA
jgi:branched-chain amino acid transport system substrate-binding protein